VTVKAGDCSTMVKRPVMFLLRPKVKQSILIVVPTLAQIWRNWFRLSKLTTIVAIGLQKLYAKSELQIVNLLSFS
jgi:hypothetical protein